MTDSLIPVVVIVGPTASGKTALSVECALRYNGEIVSADSMQIYKGMNIATAKPATEEMKGIRHHLIDFLSPEEKYSVADFVLDAKKVIFDIHSRNKLPIISGGTGLYVDSLIENIKFIDIPTDYELRNRLKKQLDADGAEKMLSQLSEFDAESAKKLHPNNTKRIIRAIEVYMLTGKTMAQIEIESKSNPSPFSPTFIGINYRDRNVLYDRINRRVDIMLSQGLLEEAEKYYNLKSGTAAQAIGYKELTPYFENKLSLDECIQNLKQSTRNYAKRQLTWFGKNKKINWFYPDDYSDNDLFFNSVYKIIER